MVTLFRWLWKTFVLASAFGIGYIIGREHSYEEEEEWESEEEERKEKDGQEKSDKPAEPVVTGAVQAVTFNLENPTATSVSVVGDFNDWNKDKTPMTKDGNVWKTSLNLKPGRHEFKYVVNSTDWLTDPKAGETVADKYGGRSSVIEVK